MKYLLFLCLLLSTACEKQDPLRIIERCQEITRVDRLDECVSSTTEIRSAGSGEYYLLVLDKQREAELMGRLEAQGFSRWVRGGIDYGPINEGWKPTEDLVYSIIKEPRETRLVAHSKSKGILYVIHREK